MKKQIDNIRGAANLIKIIDKESCIQLIHDSCDELEMMTHRQKLELLFKEMGLEMRSKDGIIRVDPGVYFKFDIDGKLLEVTKYGEL